jgi:hypothetical protein
MNSYDHRTLRVSNFAIDPLNNVSSRSKQQNSVLSKNHESLSQKVFRFLQPYNHRDHCAVCAIRKYISNEDQTKWSCPGGDSQDVQPKYGTIRGEIITEFLPFLGRSPTFCSHYLCSFGALPGRRLWAVRTRQRIPNSENKCLRSSFCGFQGLDSV